MTHETKYLIGMLDWLRRLLAWQIALTREIYGSLAHDEYRGLYIPSAEADILSSATPALPYGLVQQRDELAAAYQALDAQLYAAEAGGANIPLLRVARLFGLSSFERQVLLLVLAPELDLRYERIYAFIQDDVSRRRPSVDLALRLFCPTPEERIRQRAAFGDDGPLLRQRLIQLFEDGQRQPPLLGRFIKLDERIVAELIGQPAIDTHLASFASLTRPRRPLADLVLPDGLADRLRHMMTHSGSGLVLALRGSYGSGRRAIAESLCAEAGIPLLSVALDRLVERDPASGQSPGPLELMRRIAREAALQGAAILWQAADQLLRDDALGVWRVALLAALDEHQGWSFLALERDWEARGMLRHARFLRVELPEPSYSERERLWRLRLNGENPGDATLEALASTFRLSGGQVRDAVTMARALAQWQGAPISAHELYAACRAQSSGRLESLAQKIKTTYRWDDIVLPRDQVGMLTEICVQVRHRRTVLERWGFDRHLAMGKGVNVLFAGQSGTGKTMAAEIIAADLGLELYKVDLSSVVSKYIGETEKNLDGIFTAAREANAILFFDEADALFGKRSEVKDAHDRYANIEVGYLLQKMEEYDGVVILATNLRKNLDDAFVRRLHIAIDFPFPEEPDRLRIWRKVFPPEAPLADDLDLAFLARQLKLAGGNIRNIALLSAFLAAEEGAPIGMSHIIRAGKREYQKLGKLITESDFGPYLAVARG